MAYRDDILAIRETSGGAADGPTNYWTFDGVGTDIGVHNTSSTQGQADATLENSAVFTGTPITEDSTGCLDGTISTGNATCPNRDYMNDYTGNDPYETRTFTCWFELEVNAEPGCIFEEGAGVRNFAFWNGIASRVGFQAVSADAPGLGVLKFETPVIQTFRPYHVVGIWERVNGSSLAEVTIYLNGVVQDLDSPITDASQYMGPHAGDINFANTTDSLKFYHTAITPVASRKRISHFAIWNDQILNATEIKEELFEKGVLPTVTVTNQAGVDALASNLYDDLNCAIRVDVAGSITLNADNIQFTNNYIDLQYTGSGTLTWIGNTATNRPTLFSTTGGGTITTQYPVNVTFDKMKDDTEVRIYNTGTSTEIDGIEDAIAGSADNRNFTWSESAGTVVDYVIHHWSGTAPFYKTIRIEGYTIPSADVTININQLINRNAS